MSLLPLFQTIENTAMGHAIRDSQWLFPIIEATHLLGLSVIGGVVLIVNMRLLGLGLRKHPAGQLEREARPFFNASLILMLVTGFLLFSSEAVKCYYNQAYWFKMICLLLAITFTLTVQRRVAAADGNGGGSLTGKLVAIVSMLLWTGVGVGGRWIGFS